MVGLSRDGHIWQHPVDIYTVEPLLLAEPTFSDQNTNLCLAALNISDVSIENIALLKYLVIFTAQAEKLTMCLIKSITY